MGVYRLLQCHHDVHHLHVTDPLPNSFLLCSPRDPFVQHLIEAFQLTHRHYPASNSSHQTARPTSRTHHCTRELWSPCHPLHLPVPFHSMYLPMYSVKRE